MRLMNIHASPRAAGLLLAAALGSLTCGKAPSTAKGTTNEAAKSAPLSLEPTRGEQTAADTRSEVQGRTIALPSLAPLVEAVKAAVINVEVRAGEQPQPAFSRGDPFQDFFDRFFGRPGGRPAPPRGRIRAGLGSGFIIDQRGIALTNNHVIEGAIAIKVRLNDGRSFDAEVLGRDPPTDVGLIKFKESPQDLPVVSLGDSDALRVGDWVVAIGNPFGLTSSVSAGIISAKDRVIGAGLYDDFLQTDAAINPGNSGGPLFNLRGEVIGINTAIVGGSSSIGFAVPSNVAKALLPTLEKGQRVTRGWMGILAQTLTPDLATAMGVSATGGAVVAEVTEGTPAGKAGLKQDDVIVAVDGQPVSSSNALTRIVALKPPGTTVVLTVLRDGKKEEVKVTLGTRPDSVGAQGEGEGGSGNPEQRQAKIGLQYQDADQSSASERTVADHGALITDVLSGSAAENAGLEPGMVVIEADGKPIRRAQDLTNILRRGKPGSLILLRAAGPGGKSLHALRIPK